MKPTVHYRGSARVVMTFGNESVAYLFALDHPNHVPGQDVRNPETVRTSAVLSHDIKTGRIETRNTIYMPEVTA